MTDIRVLYDLTDRVAFVTGAGAGIGRATALALSGCGASVAVTDIDGDAAGRVAGEIAAAGGTAAAIRLDVADEAAVDAAVATVLDRFGRIDILVNNAGIGARMAAIDLPTERWRRVIEVGLDGSFYCARAVGRHMVARDSGSVVNVASIMGLTGGGLYPNLGYHAVKGALVNMTRALALEWAPHKVRVNAVAPAFVDTALVQPLLQDTAMADAILAATPLGRLVQPDEVAAAITFLASDAAAMITGHTLPVDGGWLAR